MKFQKIFRDNCTCKEQSRATFQTPVHTSIYSTSMVRHSSPKAPLLSCLAWPFPFPVSASDSVPVHHITSLLLETHFSARRCNPALPPRPRAFPGGFLSCHCPQQRSTGKGGRPAPAPGSPVRISSWSVPFT